MRKLLYGMSLLAALAGCGGGFGGLELADNQGGALVIIEMPAAGTNKVVAQLQVKVTKFDPNDPNSAQVLKVGQFGGDKLQLSSGRWPAATGSCAPLRPNGSPQTFLPGNSSCITFSLIHDFDDQNQTNQDETVSLEIRALDQNNQTVASGVKTLTLQRGLFLGDPGDVQDASNPIVFQDVEPFVATLDPAF